MSDTTTESPTKTGSTREPSVTRHVLDSDRGTLRYTATADWIVQTEKEKPVAEMFHVAYVLDDANPAERPVTFVFNGGPGAASVYLHVGALGPRIVAFDDEGNMPPPPAQLVDNPDTWLHFTDLVFIDPIGTGWSRAIDDSGDEKDAAKDDKDAVEERTKAFWTTKRDLDAISALILRWLSKHDRWSSPVYIAGESYGGYRVARLARKLHEETGVGLAGAILISPALEFSLLFGDDYNVLHWVDTLPTMAAAAFHHGKSRTDAETEAEQRAQAEDFARGDYVRALVSGAAMDEDERRAIFARAADLIGLDPEYVARAEGRVTISRYVRELLRDEARVVGLYDALTTTVDPYPDRDTFEGADPTLAGIGRMFTGAINTQLRSTLKVDDPRDYRLLSYDVFENWKHGNEGKMNSLPVGATDDLRHGMGNNPFMKVFITHGYYDLVTPYFSSDRIANQLRLQPHQRERLTVRHYRGGHMFYSWTESRRAFFDAMVEFYD